MEQIAGVDFQKSLHHPQVQIAGARIEAVSPKNSKVLQTKTEGIFEVEHFVVK